MQEGRHCAESHSHGVVQLGLSGVPRWDGARRAEVTLLIQTELHLERALPGRKRGHPNALLLCESLLLRSLRRRIFFAGKYINNYAFTMESITKGVNFYRMQYDRHAAASLRPSSPLLAAPPAFNVAAQQRLLQLQKQMRETQPTGAAALPPPLQELLRASETDSSGHTSADDEPLLAPSAECAVLNALQSSRPRLAARGPSQVEETRPSERSRQATTEKDSSGTLAAEEPSQAVSLLDASEGEKASGADSPESSTSVKPPREGADASAPHRQTEQSQTAVAPAPATFPPFEVSC